MKPKNPRLFSYLLLELVPPPRVRVDLVEPVGLLPPVGRLVDVVELVVFFFGVFLLVDLLVVVLANAVPSLIGSPARAT